MSTRPRIGAAGGAALLFLGLVAIYNANGREIATVDSQAAKLTAREVAVNRTLVLDRAIAERPALLERAAFARDRSGHVRSAYPIVPALLAAVPASIAEATGLVDMDAPLAANLIAAATASTLTAAAVALVFLALARIVPLRHALFVALGLGLGTNYWAVVSQTLWQHETVAFGLALALWSWLRAERDVKIHHLILGGLGVALAGAARPQTTPLALIFVLWIASRVGLRRAMLPVSIVAVAAVASVSANVLWFGHILGAVGGIEARHLLTHGVEGSFTWRAWTAAAGLLASPSRGILVFSPIVAVALLGLGRDRRARPDLGLAWLAGGAGLQFAFYAAYTVWWGGHTWGPRYLMDVLVPLAPAAAFGLGPLLRSRAGAIAAAVLLIWSIAVAASGALIYPNDRWNSDPVDVDQQHERLWDVRDSQIVRAFRSGLSPQNFQLFDRVAVRKAPS
jgi:hypothetical protein